MINLATILSIRNWPMSAKYGLSSISFLILAMLVFFIPSAMASAELATHFPKKGGIFIWVKEALGHRVGFLSVWLLWIENVVWYPVILSFIATSFAYSFNQSLSANNWYMFAMITGIFWIITCTNLMGMTLSGWISSLGVIFGTLIPGVLIIILSIIWICKGLPSNISFSWKAMVPDITNFSKLSYLAGILLSFCGMEMSAVHAKDVENPQKNYSRAIFISGFIIILLTILGTLSIAIVIPQNDVSLLSGSMEAIYKLLSSIGLHNLVHLVAILIAVGALGGVSTWTAGPCRGLLAAAEDGDFPPLMRRANKHNMPINLMIMQAIIVSLLSIVFIFMPTVSSSFWLLTVLSSQLYLIMYILMFMSCIILRYKEKNSPNAYKIPGGNIGLWGVNILGLISCIFTIVIGFFPPEGIGITNKLFFELFLLSGIIIFCGAPFLIYAMRTEKWIHPKI